MNFHRMQLVVANLAVVAPEYTTILTWAMYFLNIAPLKVAVHGENIQLIIDILTTLDDTINEQIK